MKVLSELILVSLISLVSILLSFSTHILFKDILPVCRISLHQDSKNLEYPQWLKDFVP